MRYWRQHYEGANHDVLVDAGELNDPAVDGHGTTVELGVFAHGVPLEHRSRACVDGSGHVAAPARALFSVADEQCRAVVGAVVIAPSPKGAHVASALRRSWRRQNYSAAGRRPSDGARRVPSRYEHQQRTQVDARHALQ